MKAATPQSTAEADTRKLMGAVEFMDGLAQEGFSVIAAVAKLALVSLETPEGHHNLSNIYFALEAIAGKAEEIQNCINHEAEKVGCSYTNDQWNRRRDAAVAARLAS
ncbi:MAG: hypothetical protein LBJ15_18190 [Comamonas sp.]|jgi:hypothetical protein|uniref:hypothetical protein n=1 Tax=Comamonas sp. TaxID=34028 RepID=UPI00282AD39D|nr:hypothetical protein [Comamonas sp.]MDR0215907.1 hypothetical protein [Comamonas sp.]